MSTIAVAGAGISGLTVALRLQQEGVDVALYTDRDAGQLRAGRLPNSVIRFHPTRHRERMLGVDHWDFDDFGVFSVHVDVGGEEPLGFVGELEHAASGVDFRIYLARLLEDFERRGGRIAPVRSLDEATVSGLALGHELTVVAGGRGLERLFPRLPASSPFTRPQRLLCAGLYHGIGSTAPLGVSINVAPGVGEVFQAPFFSFDGRVSALLFEAIPGGPMEEISGLPYDVDPQRFESTVLRLLEEFAPRVRDRVDVTAFGLTRSADLLQGAITPVVRRAWADLGDGHVAIAVGDAWVLNDPIVGQGANLGSHSAWTLAEAVLRGGPYDARFCGDVERRMWSFAGPVVNFSNTFLQPPTPHVSQLLGAAASDRVVADALVNNFADPPAMWQAIGTEAGADQFLADVRDRGRTPDRALAPS